MILRAFAPSPGVAAAPTCKYHPSCSRYAADAVRRHGVIKGSVKTVWRLGAATRGVTAEWTTHDRRQPPRPDQNVLIHVIDWLGPHGAIGLPWAWAIVGLTVMVRMLLVPLTVKQIHSMQNLQRHAPEMKEIQRKYKQDKQKMNEELMRFYKENRINPAASCLPIVLQIPIFLSLYFVLKHFTDNVDYVKGDNLEWLGLVNILDPANVGWGVLLIVIYLGSQLASTYFMSATVDQHSG